MDGKERYKKLVDALAEEYGERLKMIVLFGSQSRGEAKPDSDHDIFVVIDELSPDPLARQREVMIPLLPFLLDLPEHLSVTAKTSQELSENLTPLVVDLCMDGIGLYGKAYFAALQTKVQQALREAGLQRRLLAGTWMWTFPAIRQKEWEISWEGFRESV